ncbi:hypothetical protein CIPAW_03G082200 [Carya illinoinensis]|uniref:Uncharacterized protein n=1 Tax=Carya illinoinensis TaxID=32201 RepID=A0A8T1R188_CARIL|nr:hypothetical protein CIPAW_03G082200 [Carya illinoinensis]
MFDEKSALPSTKLQPPMMNRMEQEKDNRPLMEDL